MTKTPLISIVMPVRNEAKHLNACLKSIISQTYTNWELIAVDDHSEDGSRQLLCDWTLKDPRILTCKNEGKGIIPALQTALKKACGEYVTRMDADDLMLPCKLKELIRPLLGEEADLSTGRIKYSGRNLQEGFLKYQRWINWQRRKNYWQSIYYECPLPSPCWMAKTELFRKAMSDPELMYPEDYFWAFWLYAKGASVFLSTHYLHLWRDYAERTSRTDPNYADQSFLHLKLRFFLEHDYQPQRTLLVWGAGRKGKQLARKLLEMDIPFEWTCNNPEKTGKNIYEKELLHEPAEKHWSAYQLLLAFSSPFDKAIMQSRLDKHRLRIQEDYFWFY